MLEGPTTVQAGLELGGGGTVFWEAACQARGGTVLSRHLGVGWGWEKYWD